MLLFAGDAVILGVGDAVEGLAVAVAALTQGLAVAGNGEVQPSAGLMVDAVLFQEINAALGSGQPLFLHAVDVAQVGVGPAAAALHPHALVGGVDLAGAVQTGVDTAILMVHAVFQPEVGHICQLVTDPLALGDKFFTIHWKLPPKYTEKSDMRKEPPPLEPAGWGKLSADYTPPVSRVGRNRVIWGKTFSRIRVMISGIRKGRTPLTSVLN